MGVSVTLLLENYFTPNRGEAKMDLKDFVKETLVQISSGVKDAQEPIRAQGGYVNPAARVHQTSNPAHFTTIEDGQAVFLVDFDVAVSVSEEIEKGATAKLKVASILDIGAGGKKDSSSSVTNRIGFKVPLALPVDAESKKRLLKEDRRMNAYTEEHMRRHESGD
jgi:hypothetical protein